MSEPIELFERAAAAFGRQVQSTTDAQLDGDPVATWDSAVGGSREAFSAPGALDGARNPRPRSP